MVITDIEDAIIARLKTGLGRMVRNVERYAGELEPDALGDAIRSFPAVWITFAGIPKTVRTSTSRTKQLTHSEFVVMVGDRNIRSESAGRTGGASAPEVGAYSLVWAVRRLLSEQDLGLEISALEAGRVRTLYNTRLQSGALAVFGCEFSTSWIEPTLGRGAWPCPPENAADEIFARYQGRLDDAAADWLKTHIDYLSPQSEVLASDDITQEAP